MARSDQLSTTEFEDLWARGEYYAAFKWLTEIVSNSGNGFKSTKEFKELRSQATPNQEILDSINSRIASEAEKVQHILSIGEVYNADERLLILTLATSIVNVSDMIAEIYQIELSIDIPELRTMVTKKLKNYKMRGAESKLFDRIRI